MYYQGLIIAQPELSDWRTQWQRGERARVGWRPERRGFWCQRCCPGWRNPTPRALRPPRESGRAPDLPLRFGGKFSVASVGSSPSRRPVSCVSFPFRFLRLSGGFMLCSGRSRRRCTYFGSLFLHMGLLLHGSFTTGVLKKMHFDVPCNARASC